MTCTCYSAVRIHQGCQCDAGRGAEFDNPEMGINYRTKTGGTMHIWARANDEVFVRYCPTPQSNGWVDKMTVAEFWDAVR